MRRKTWTKHETKYNDLDRRHGDNLHAIIKLQNQMIAMAEQHNVDSQKFYDSFAKNVDRIDVIKTDIQRTLSANRVENETLKCQLIQRVEECTWLRTRVEELEAHVTTT